MNPAIKNLHEKTLIGKRITMSMADNKTSELWRSFMPRRKEIKNTIGTDLFSLQIFDIAHNFYTFNPHAIFEKWAAVEVNNSDIVPHEMEPLQLVGGLYAVFLHIGPASEGVKTFQHIFGVWLPASEYIIDNRPHFEILGEKYKNDDPNSEEEIWIPIKPKEQFRHTPEGNHFVDKRAD